MKQPKQKQGRRAGAAPIGLVVLALSLVALVADAQRRPVLEDLGSRRLVIDHELAPLDAQRVEPDGCIFEVARSAERDRLEIDAHGPSLSPWGAHAPAVAVLRGDRLVTGVMFGGGLALVFDDHGAAHWARVLGAGGDDGASEWSLLWAASRCAAQPPAERLCLTPVRAATDDE